MKPRQPSLPFAAPKRAAAARAPEIEPFDFQRDGDAGRCEPRTLANVPEWLRLCWDEEAG